MEAEWDEAKRLRNLGNHGVDFRDAVLIFLSPVIEAEDIRSDYGESRIRALGHVEDDYFMVVYTWRASIRRIISAWKVNENAGRRYDAILSRKPSQDAGSR
jgi:uncharacterized protein